ncbi:MAG: histidinol-phosphatase [Erysipelotrichaceae bacterium]|nr:histidinol-phosphatase [Erysipelotrichaceae bacterium]MBO4537884.1 histidinol-phosphatase [Erysipelotrichaceae bacterium]
MRQDFNYHTHTIRCGHAVGSDEEYVRCAVQAGYRLLGFADHGPNRFYSNPRSHMEWSQIDEYLESIASLQRRYEGQIRLLAGFETEYFPQLHDEKVFLKRKSDYLILGQHFLHHDGQGSFFKTNSEEEILEYGRAVCRGMESGLFMYVCHPDLIMYRQSEFTDACAQVADMIGRKAAETGMPLEVNVHRIAKGRVDFAEGPRFFYPHREFWEILARYPVRCLFGVDAHDPHQLAAGSDMETAYEELQDLGLSFLTEPLI